jgi:tRNA threonylcarbamoyladenosine biosynthesis protein TsaB
MTEPTPRFLILETSGRVGCLALAEGDAILAVRHLEESRRHARDLAPAVSEMLAAQRWRPADLSAVIVSRGPGSYTGLRVGLISAQMFAYATGCQVIAIDTFAAIAAQAPPSVRELAVLADAQQEKVYVQRFGRSRDEQWQAVSELTIESFADLLNRRSPEVCLTGPGLEKWSGKLPADLPVVERSLWYPTVHGLLALGLPRWRRGEASDLRSLEPLYARPSAAEEQWDKRPG